MEAFFDDSGLTRRGGGRRLERTAAPAGGRPLPEGVRVALSELSTPHLELPEIAAAARGQGFHGIGVLRRTVWRCDGDWVADLLQDEAVGAETLAWAGGFTGTMGYSFREAVADCRTACSEAVRIGARTLLIAGGGRGCHTLRHARRLVRDGLSFAAELGQMCGIDAALLTAPPEPSSKWTFLASCEEALALVDSVSSAALGLALDLERWQAAGCSTDLQRQLARRTRVLQIAVPTERLSDPPGWSDSSRAALDQLLADGFRGVIELRLARSRRHAAAPAHPATHCRAYIEALGLNLASRERFRSGTQTLRW